MRVYEIRIDTTINYQAFFFDDYTRDKDSISHLMKFGELPNGWVMPEVYVLEPRLSKPNFFSINYFHNCFAVDRYTWDKVLTTLEMSGQLVDFNYKNEAFTLFKPIHCYDCLDVEKTLWEEQRAGIVKHEFKPNRLSNAQDSPIFTIPELNSMTMYLVDGMMGDEEEEFKYCIEKYDLKGLLLKEVWHD